MILRVPAFRQSSVDYFQRKLNLPRRPRRLADDPEPAPVHNVRRQPKIHDIKDVEELCAKLERSHFRIATMAERCVFNERKIEVVKCGPTECVAPKSAETPAMRPGSSRNIDGDVKEGYVVFAHAEVIVPHRPTGRKIRHGNKIRTITH